MSDIKEIVNDLGKTFEDFKQKNDERLAQIEKNGKADPLLEEQVQKMSTRISELDELKARIEQAETVAARKSVAADDGEQGAMEQKAKRFAAMASKRRGVAAPGDFGAKELASYKNAFDTFLRKGDLMGLDALKALSVGSDPDGGYLVHPDMSGRIVQKIFETSPMRQVAAQQTIGTDALEGSYDLDEAAAGWVGETETRAETDTPQIGKWRIPVHEIYAKPKATQKVLDDAEVDLEAWLSGKVSDKFTRTENAAFVTGDGIGKPRGFLTYSSGTTLPGTIERKTTGVNGGFATDGTGGDCLMDLVYSLKQGYRSGARFFMNRSIVNLVRQIKDSNGMYIWQPGIAASQPSTLLGFPILEMEDMPDAATDSLSIAFGNMGEAYQIVDRQGIRVLRDPYSAKPYIELYTTKRVGGDVLNFEAIKLLEFTA